MKITKLLPIAFALALVSPAFAAESAKSDMTMTLDKYLNVTCTSGATLTTLTTFDTDYAGINLTTAFAPSFKVVTNDPTQKMYLKASTTASDGATQALYKMGDTSDIAIVFANTKADHIPTKDQIAAITAGPATTIETNPNCIAFKFTPTGGAAQDTAGGGSVTPTVKANMVEYAMTNGIYNYTYTSDTTAVSGTFSTHDSLGDYKATLTLTSSST